MIRRKNTYKETTNVYYICGKYNRKKGCTRHSIHEDDLYQIVLTTLSNHIATLVSMENIMDEIDLIDLRSEDVLANSSEVQEKLDQIAVYEKLSAALFADVAAGIISQEEMYKYRDYYNSEVLELKESINSITETMKELIDEGVVNTLWLEKFKKHKDIQ